VGSSGLTPLTSVTPSVIESTEAEYYFTNVIEGQTITFPIEFIKENGIWKISEF